MKKIIISIAAGFATLSFGLAIFYAGQFLVSMFQTQEVETVEVIPKVAVESKQITIDELFHPKPVVINEVIEETETQTEDKNYEFNPDGHYYIIGEQKGFEDITHFCISTVDYSKAAEESNDSYENYRIPPTGHLEQDKEFNFTRVALAYKKIAFETETKNGISFEFTGEFIDGEEVKYKTSDGETYTDYAVLKGTLIKKRKGKKIAESKVEFGEGGC